MKSSVRSLTHSLLRVPLGSVNYALALFDASTRHETASWLREFYRQPVHSQALYLASPTLFHEVNAWLQTMDVVLPPDLELAVARYAIRSSSRSTPFGLFAGLTLAVVDQQTELRFAPERLSPFTRLDSSALVQLYEQLINDTRWRYKLSFVVSNSAYRAKTQYRYSEFVESNRARLVVMSGLDVDDYLTALTDYAQVYRSFDELKRFISGMAGVDDQEAGSYIDALIDSKFLLSELEPTVTGPPYVERVTRWLTSLDPADELATWLVNQPTVVEHLMTVATLQKTDNWLVRRGISSVKQQSFWQTNLWFKTQTATLARPIVNQIGNQIAEVFPVLEQPRPGWIHLFAQRFKNRYQGRSVPLLEVLDNESGIGLRSATDYLSSPAPRAELLLSQLSSGGEPRAATGPTDTLRRRLLEQARRTNTIESEVTAKDLTTGEKLPWEGYWSVLGTLLGSQPAAQAGGQYDFMLRYVSANPTALAGRFCRDSDELTDFVRMIHDKESQRVTDGVLAEVVHLAGIRSGNVNVRPTLRAYEIPYLTPASVPDEYVINLSELLVSVNDSFEITLFSPRLNKQVIPRLTTAHNVAQGDEIYRFLCGVGQQRNAAALWSWKELVTEPFLPRVRYKNLILSRAQWHISADTLKRFASAQVCWQWFKESYCVPTQLTIQTGDNELVADTDTPMGNRFVVDELAKRKEVTLTEWLSTPDRCWIRDSADQPYCHEAMLFYESPVNLPVRNKAGVVGQFLPEPVRPVRKFPPGSEWLYLKLYCGPETANELLRGQIGEVLTTLNQQAQIQQWFFVRYYDPEFHLRLRVRCHDPALGKQIMTQLLASCAQWLADGFIDSVQLDTYDRELERYGSQTIDECEDYFTVDSRMIVHFLSQYPDADEEVTIHFAVASALALATDFGLTDADCLTFFRSRQRAYHHEFSASKEIKDALNQQFRGYREKMKDWQPRSQPADEQQTETSSMTEMLDRRSFESRQIVDTLNQKMIGTDSATALSTVGSLLHMSMNRLFTSQLRVYELIVYHLCCRYYESIVARSKD